MHPKIQAQNDSIRRFATTFTETLHMDEQTGLTIAKARHEWIENYLDQLEAERQQLNDELTSIVLTYTAKIRLIDELIRAGGRESEKQVILKELCEERGLPVDEKATTDASG